jgi:hypothetical protein
MKKSVLTLSLIAITVICFGQTKVVKHQPKPTTNALQLKKVERIQPKEQIKKEDKQQNQQTPQQDLKKEKSLNEKKEPSTSQPK